jgi:enoyl-CoA hydratase/carnithine racemase
MTQSILFTQTGNTGTITLDDGKANAMSIEWFASLGKALDQAEAAELSVLVFRGRPGFFSGGLDIKRMPTLTADELKKLRWDFAAVMLRVLEFPVPTIARIEGHAIAGGAILALACDLRLALDGSHRFQMNEVAIGIPVPEWMILIAETSVPQAEMVKLLLHAKPYMMNQAAAAGLVHSVHPNVAELDAEIAAAIAALAPLNRAAYAKTKGQMRQASIDAVLERM